MTYLPLISLIIAIVAAIASALALIKIWSLQKMRQGFFAGKDVASLEQFIINQNKRINDLVAETEEIEKFLKKLDDQQKLAIQKMGVVRYNPFADNGGNLSFSIALLDAKNNGVIITSMHGREQNRIYAKPILKGVSEFTLTEEETKAIKQASIIKNFTNN